ncbi:hypothetical protein D3C81_1383730 [compost metagenome]
MLLISSLCTPWSSWLAVCSSIDWVMTSSPTRLMIWSTLSTGTRRLLVSALAAAAGLAGLGLLDGALAGTAGAAVATAWIAAATAACGTALAASGCAIGSAAALAATGLSAMQSTRISSCSGSTMKHITASMSSASSLLSSSTS